MFNVLVACGSDSTDAILSGLLAAGEIEGDAYEHPLDVLRGDKVPTGR